MRCLKLVLLIATIIVQPVCSGAVAAEAAPIKTDVSSAASGENVAKSFENDPVTPKGKVADDTGDKLANKKTEEKTTSTANLTKNSLSQTNNSNTSVSKADKTLPAPTSATPATPVDDANANNITAPSPVAARGDILVSAFKSDPRYGYAAIEIYNSSGNFVDLKDISLEMHYSTAATDFVCNVKLQNYIRPKSYLTLYHPIAPHDEGSLLLNGCPAPNTTDMLLDKEIIVYQGGAVIEVVRVNNSDLGRNPTDIWERKGWTAVNRTGVFKTDFRVRSSSKMLSSDLYQVPPAPSLRILEILPNPSDCATADPNLACHSYVKVKNIGQDPIDLSQYRLRSGNQTAQSAINNTSRLSGVVLPGKMFVIFGKSLNIAKKSGTVWLQDVNGLVDYDNNVTPYQKADSSGNEGRSWAYDARTGAWRWATPNPGSENNNFAALRLDPGKGRLKDLTKPKARILKPCRDDQYRSEETGRCRNIIQSKKAAILKPCKEGQYRSEETGRCRSIAKTAAAALKPCKEGQFRNPKTGRCKKIASVDDLPKPCKEGWERNPSTGRCRKIRKANSTLAAYPVQPATVQVANPAIWWTIGALLLAGASYGVWEWRAEIGRGLRKIIQPGRK